MKGTIRTKWHNFVDAALAEQIYLPATKEGYAPPALDYITDPEDLKDFGGFLKVLDTKLPKFVVDHELVKLAAEDAAQRSFIDMEKAGVLRLPYPCMLVEYPITDRSQAIVYLRDLSYPEPFEWEAASANDKLREYGAQFYGFAMVAQKDQHGSYAIVSPDFTIMRIVADENGDPAVTSFRGGVLSFVDMEKYPKLSEHAEKVKKKTMGYCYRALFAALLLMTTEGVEKEVIECTKLNKHRKLSNKTPVPRHTYIHIAKVYKSASSDASEPYVPGKSPRPHWRRGHARRIAYGVNRAERKWKFFFGRIVAMPKDTVFDDDSVALPDYVVTK